jgi:hypothetical protein
VNDAGKCKVTNALPGIETPSGIVKVIVDVTPVADEATELRLTTAFVRTGRDEAAYRQKSVFPFP